MCIVKAAFLWFLFTPCCREAFCIIRLGTDPDRLMTFLFPCESSWESSAGQTRSKNNNNTLEWFVYGKKWWKMLNSGTFGPVFVSEHGKLLHPTAASSLFPLGFFFFFNLFFNKFAIIKQSGMMAQIKSWGKFKWSNSKCVFHRELSVTSCSKWLQA